MFYLRERREERETGEGQTKNLFAYTWNLIETSTPEVFGRFGEIMLCEIIPTIIHAMLPSRETTSMHLVGSICNTLRGGY